MTVRTKAIIVAVLLLVIALSLTVYLQTHTVAVLNTEGIVAEQERSLMGIAVALGMIVILPVYGLTAYIAWKYRESNKSRKKYSPSWDHSRWLEGVWWTIPLIIITVLSVVTWRSSYALDPFKPLVSSAQPLKVQVIALDWKWLFIYPEQGVASVNQVQFPINRPVTYDITSDSVMNSFWIPQLGGQIYAMPGMSTQLHLMAGKTGTFKGSSANISGNGFAGMTFSAKAESEKDFNDWITRSAKSSSKLTLDSYNQLAKPSRNTPVSTYSLGTSNLYEYVIMKYMTPGGEL